jgi:hypothetical protein
MLKDCWGAQGQDGKPHLIWYDGTVQSDGRHTIYSIPLGGANSLNATPKKDQASAIDWFIKSSGHQSPQVFPRMLGVGQRFPRIWRLGQNDPFHERTIKATLSIGVTTTSLLKQLANTFEAIEPHEKNAKTFSHNLRHLLILVCTEVEAAWKGILKANGYTTSGRMTTNDYVKLLPVLKLDSWVLQLLFYTDYPSLQPFKGWSASNPTESLPWYAAHHAVKHDREEQLHQATLENVIMAFAALLALGAAQFGPKLLSDMANENNMGRSVFAQTHFHYVEKPTWDAGECYFPPFGKKDWEFVNYSF